MEKGINLSLTKSLADFDTLLDQAIEEIPSHKISVAHDLEEVNVWKFQVGKYMEVMKEDDEDESVIFWIGYGWEENDKRESMIWLEFDAKTCPEKYWDKIHKLAGTTGKYYREVGFEFAQVYMNSWVHFYLREEYLKQFYDENIGISTQKEILSEFIMEVLELL